MLISIQDDFDLRRIAESGQCFRWTQAPDGAYRVIHGQDCLYIASAGENLYSFECGPSALPRWQAYFDLEENYRSIRGRIDPETDPFLFAAAREEQGIRILRQQPFEALISFIISQNKNIPAIRRAIERLCEAAGQKLVDSRGFSYFAFPDPERLSFLSEDALKGCGLGYRWKYVSLAARAAAEGKIDWAALADASEQDTMAYLTRLYGVGVKVASCVSLFGLHHLDAFPQDVWIKRIVKAAYPRGYPFSLYHPYNGVYQQYLFAYYRKHADAVKASPVPDAASASI